MIVALSIIVVSIGFMFLTNYISYTVLKKRVLQSQTWDLNICCGRTDGGGINADIVQHTSVPNFYMIEDINNLPFRDKHFKTVLCSHTIEHVDDPRSFYYELTRIGENVTLVLPPLWDLSAAFNIIEHKWLFLTIKKEHSTLPPFIRLPFASIIQEKFGQRIKA